MGRLICVLKATPSTDIVDKNRPVTCISGCHVLKQLPDDCTLEHIQYHLYVLQRIENRLRDAEHGEFVTQDEAEARLAKWLTR